MLCKQKYGKNPAGTQMEESQQLQNPSKFHRKVQAQDGYRTKQKCQNLSRFEMQRNTG